MPFKRCFLNVAATCAWLALLIGAAPIQAAAPIAKRMPPLGIDVPAAKRALLQKKLDSLGAQIAELARRQEGRIHELVPDVRIFWQAVQTALADQEFYNARDIETAFALLDEGRARATALAEGEAPWATQHGLVVRGYISRLDGSVQPYGLVVPESYNFSEGKTKHRLDLWLHGRGETLSEVNFLRDREKNVGTFAPPDTIVLHPYGRYCNANKFAGEIDVFEAIDSVRRRYRIDEDRVVVRGFSMGGASTWHLAVHYPDHWAAANPGAGFAETPQFAQVFHNVTLTPTWWETKLFHLYDCTDWAGNLRQCPTVAYSGELDSQKQAADIMAQALKREGLELVHVIGPKTKHRYHPQARDEVERLVSALAAKGRVRFPQSVNFTTYTLRYNKCDWITVDAIKQHWERARIEADREADGFLIRTANVQAFTIRLPSGEAPFGFSPAASVAVRIEPLDQEGGRGRTQFVAAEASPPKGQPWTASFHREGERWVAGPLSTGTLRKKHALQGPIDDAFLDAFLFVRPTAKASSPRVEAWVQSEMKRAIREWRRQFRGEPRVKDDKDVTEADIASRNLVLWGDLSSNSANSVIAKIADKLPIREKGSTIFVDSVRRFDAADHVPILICPNPLNPERYVVLNSGFTFRERAYMSNALQVPKLPDWAIVDVRIPPDADWPGKIAAADFFDEEWQVRSSATLGR